MRGTNLLILMGDEHNRDFLGVAGHYPVSTPHLDRLAERGTRFSAAYTPSPICVPARASLQCGRLVSEIGAWDSATPYRGKPLGWGHRLRAAGRRCLSVGKLHFMRSEDDNGFEPELLPMHIWKGLGWTTALLRDDPPASPSCREYAEELGPGRCSYTDYDEKVAAEAARWIASEGSKDEGAPWTLFVSLTAPHFPLLVPDPFWAPYENVELPPPAHYRTGAPRHPVLERLARCLNYDDYFDDARVAMARRSYCGLISFVDHNVGLVLKALEASGQADRTVVIYTSDHGDSMGAHSFWAKSTMYEHSAGVPFLMAGPDVPRGHVEPTPVSLVDIHPTAIQAGGLAPSEAEADLPGCSLIELARSSDPDRPVISEYHDGGAITGMTMLRQGPWKYVHYVGHAPQLFDLEADPTEGNDLGTDPAHAATRDRLEAELRRHVDPERANERAFADQAVAIDRLGGREAVISIGDFGYTPLPTGT